MTATVLHSQIGRNVLTYVDDIIVKSTKQENHIADLQETFANFRQAGLKLNPEKYVFGVKKEKFLGCLVSTKGIEANPNKIEAILQMEPPSTKKGAQRFSVKNIPRGENEHADLLAKSAAQGLPLPSEVFFETIKAPSVDLLERAVLNICPVYSEDWRTEIMSFLQGNFLSDDEAYHKRIAARARPYVIIEGELYKHGVCSPLLK
jgi:hypothetical protein